MDQKTRNQIKHQNKTKSPTCGDADTDVALGNAVRCHECGFIGARIQWTHLRYACSGRVKTIEEYRRAHPTALLVAPNSAKLLGCTKDKLVSLYGEEAGNRLWDDYREKQAVSNSFSQKAEKHGWDIEQYNAFNKMRATTVDNLVRRHGEDIGLQKWNDYCERQRHTCSLDYFKAQWGEIEGTQRYNKWMKSWVTNGKTERDLLTQLKRMFSEITWTSQFRIPRNNEPDRRFGYFYDLCSVDLGVVIEFNGTHWHLDPRFYGADSVNSKGTVAADKWEADRLKISAATSHGFLVFVIWEHDWVSDRNAVLTNLEKVINERKTNKNQINTTTR